MNKSTRFLQKQKLLQGLASQWWPTKPHTSFEKVVLSAAMGFLRQSASISDHFPFFPALPPARPNLHTLVYFSSCLPHFSWPLTVPSRIWLCTSSWSTHLSYHPVLPIHASSVARLWSYPCSLFFCSSWDKYWGCRKGEGWSPPCSPLQSSTLSLHKPSAASHVFNYFKV